MTRQSLFGINDAAAYHEIRRIMNLTQEEIDAAQAGYIDGEDYAPTSPSNAFKAREIALAVAVQLASSAAPGEDVSANVIKDAEVYLAFLTGQP